MYRVGYIFTESFFNVLTVYINIYIYIYSIFLTILQNLSNYLPVFIKYLIGYCHFYYQLGYGLIFYIYLYRRRKAKKTKNWQSFYGNSVSNWVFFNIYIFNKFIFNRNFFVFLKSKIIKYYKFNMFLLNSLSNTNSIIYNLKSLKIIKLFKLQVWTPIFKKSSYISFLTFLKRFNKRK